MEKKTVQWYDGEQQHLRQAIYSGVEFSFISANNKQVSPFAYCKDYLQDAVQGHLNQQATSIFGFVYDPQKHDPICIKKTRLLVTNAKDFEFVTKLPNCLDFLHQVEKQLKIKKTIVFECENPPLQYIRSGVFLFEGSTRWIKSPPMISLYSLCIRLGFGHTIGDEYITTIDNILTDKKPAYQPIDADRLKQAKKGIDRILKVGDRSIFGTKAKNNYPSNIDTNIMHNNFGISGFAKGVTKKHIPAWHKV